MELFKITCVTCRARLSVRDAALVGQIIGCPRCGMMVQVAAPAGALPATPNDSTASAAIVALAAVNAPPQPSFETIASFDDAADVLSFREPAAAVPSPPLLPAEAPTATGWPAYKFATLLVAGAVAGSAVVAASLSWFNDEDQVAVAAPANPVAAGPSAVSEQPEEPPPAKLAPADSEGPPTATTTEPEKDEALPGDDPEPVNPAAAPATQMVSADPEVATPPATSDAKTQAEQNPPAAVDTAPRLRIDPLDVDPEGLNLSTLYSGPPTDPLAESQLPTEEEAAPSAPPAVPNPDDDDAQHDAPAAVRRDARAGVGAPVSVDVLLALRLPAINLEKMPLCQLLDLATQLSGLPVSVSPQQLRMAAVSATTPASADAKDVTVEQMLTAALKPLRLKPMIDGEQIVLMRNGDDKRRNVEYAVDDLASSPANVEQLADWVQQLTAPEAWQAGGGDATLAIDGAKLRIEAPVAVQYDVLFLLERYRLTRGLPTRTKYPAALLASGAFHAAIAERLAAPAAFTFSQYTPLREIFRYWQEELAVAVLVDWPALADERLWPSARIACSAADKSWAEAMDSVLEPLGLGWRAVGRNTIEITTLAKIRSEQVFEVYRISPSATLNAEQLIARVQSFSASDAKPPATADLRQAAAAIAYDAESRVLLVRQPAAIHRQLVAETRDVLEIPGTAAAPQ